MFQDHLNRFKDRLDRMTPYQWWRVAYSIGDYCGFFIGILIYRDASRPFRVIPFAAVPILHTIFMFYTFSVLYKDNMFLALAPFSISAICLPVSFNRIIGNCVLLEAEFGHNSFSGPMDDMAISWN